MRRAVVLFLLLAMVGINAMKIDIPAAYEEALHNTNRYLVLGGGAGSGKSEFCGRKIFYRCQKEGNHKFLILRKVRRTCKESVVAVMLGILNENEVPYQYNRTDRTIVFYNPDGKKNILLFEGMDDPEKIKSIKGVTGIWLEETTEFTERDFNQLDLRLRGKTDHYKQIMLSFNPDESVGAWIKETFFDHQKPDSYILITTVDDNPFIDQEYIDVLDNIKDPTYYLIYRKGLWAAAKGLIYHNVQKLAEFPGSFDETIYGLDFGFNKQSALVEVNIKDGVDAYLRSLIYQTKLTNPDFIREIEKLNLIKRRCFYADGAEPDRIEEFKRAGFNIYPADKSKNSVKDGIDHVKTYNLHTLIHDEPLNKEFRIYKWEEDKNGKLLDQPVKYMDHLMDGARYALYTHYKRKADITIKGLKRSGKRRFSRTSRPMGY